MGNNIKFSVCIPNFNYGRYLKQTIESVLNQTYPVYEIILASIIEIICIIIINDDNNQNEKICVE